MSTVWIWAGKFKQTFAKPQTDFTMEWDDLICQEET